MIPEREREALMRLTMCAREECGMCKYKDTCDFDFQYEIATRCMNILADALNADRKTESNSEIPNNFDKDINVRSKDEPQTDIGIGCSRCGVRFGCIDRGMPHAVYCNSYGKITDEPQERSRR